MKCLSLLALSLPLFCSMSATAVETNAADNPVVARGKNFEVRRDQLDEAWAIYAARMSRGGQLPDEPRASVESKLLTHIVETEILLQKATPAEKNHASSD